MASVRMSDSLRSKIKKNFEKQIRTAYSNSSELQPFVQNLINSSLSDIELELIERDVQLAKDVWEYKNPNGVYEKRTNAAYNDTFHFNSNKKIAFILNPARSDSEDCTFLDTSSNKNRWHKSYYSSYREKTFPPSDTFQEGDVSLILELTKSVTTTVNPDISQVWSADGNELELSYPFIISKEETLTAISTYAEGTLKIDKSIETMSNLLKECTTLKRFLDAWPAGKDCVPQEVLNKQFEAAKPRSAGPSAPKFNAETLLPDEVKEQMNSAVLTSKLLS
tara:strand:- start:863 stop:1699 length:837 start_codon:yes stop_codon:yes gene_type:complete